MNIAILASGNGSNFEAIVRAQKNKFFSGRVKLLITDNKNAFVRTRARRHGVVDVFIDPQAYTSRRDFDRHVAAVLKKEKIGFVILAGYMRVLSADFVRSFAGRVINIHPAILPSFRGTGSIKRAYEYGCKVTGVTVHFVDEKVDNGPIILQDVVEINQGMSLEELERKVHKLEHKLYPQAIKLLLSNKVTIKGRRVQIRR